MAPEARTITLNDELSLSYAEQGDPSGPALVLLPGPTDSWRSYQAVLDHLPTSVRAVAVSQRGHGDSDKPPTGYGIEDFAGDVIPLLDALGIERAVLGGHSGSCFVARRVAIDHPHRVVGLVLEASPTTLRGDEGLEGFVRSVVAGLGDPIDPAFARAFVVDTSSEGLAPEVVDEVTAELLKVPARVWHETFAGLLAYDDRHELSRIAAPSLLIWGDGDRLVDRAAQDALLALLTHGELRVHGGSGHAPRIDDPARFAADVAAFVSKAS